MYDKLYRFNNAIDENENIRKDKFYLELYEDNITVDLNNKVYEGNIDDELSISFFYYTNSIKTTYNYVYEIMQNDEKAIVKFIKVYLEVKFDENKNRTIIVSEDKQVITITNKGIQYKDNIIQSKSKINSVLFEEDNINVVNIDNIIMKIDIIPNCRYYTFCDLLYILYRNQKCPLLLQKNLGRIETNINSYKKILPYLKNDYISNYLNNMLDNPDKRIDANFILSYFKEPTENACKVFDIIYNYQRYNVDILINFLYSRFTYEEIKEIIEQFSMQNYKFNYRDCSVLNEFIDILGPSIINKGKNIRLCIRKLNELYKLINAVGGKEPYNSLLLDLYVNNTELFSNITYRYNIENENIITMLKEILAYD